MLSPGSIARCVVLLAVSTAGCAVVAPDRSASYQTVPDDPYHDTPAAETENEKGLELLRRGAVQAAEEAFGRALVADVMFGPAHNNLGKIYYQSGRYYLAAWEFEYAGRLMAERAEPVYNLGLLHESIQDVNGAINYYVQAYQREPYHPMIIGSLARARVRQGRKDAETRALLSELLFYETRPEWRAWAHELLATHRWPDQEATGVTPQSEILPPPAPSPARANPDGAAMSRPNERPDTPPWLR